MIRTSSANHGYDLSLHAATDLAQQYLQEHPLPPGTSPKPFDIRMLHGTGSEALLAEAVEGWSFGREFGNTADYRVQVWSGFTERSFSITAFAEIGHGRGRGWVPCGTIRLISGSQTSHFQCIPYLKDIWSDTAMRTFADYQVEWTSAWEVATLATDQTLHMPGPARLLPWAMLHTLYRAVQTNNVRWLFGILSDRAYAGMDRSGLGLIPLGEAKDVKGQPRKPFLVNIDRLPETLRSQPRYADLLINGITPGGRRLDLDVNFPEEMLREGHVEPQQVRVLAQSDPVRGDDSPAEHPDPHGTHV